MKGKIMGGKCRVWSGLVFWGCLVLVFSSCKNVSTDWEAINGSGSESESESENKRPEYEGFVWAEGGTFTMGSPVTEAEKYNIFETQHSVTLTKGFYIAKYQVTQKEWQEVMGDNPSRFLGEDLPVEMVSWYDAVEYCNKRSEKEGLTPAYTIDKINKDPNNITLDKIDALKWTVTLNSGADGYRLPTESEWEYAARGGNNENNPYYLYAGSNDIDDVAWYFDNSSDMKTHPVGTKAPNALGLYDMSGNVMEWCWDWFNYYPSDSRNEDPQGAPYGSTRIVRGGGWVHSADLVRSAYRDHTKSNYQDYSLGLRLVRPGPNEDDS